MTDEVIRLSMPFTRHTCRSCGVEYLVPEAFDKGRRETKATWYCPNGHSWAYTESSEDKLRRERDRLAQKIAEKDDELRAAWNAENRQAELRRAGERKLSAAKGQITRIKKRASNGVCPCCNRTFADLARHMAGKHPGFISEATADEHVH